MRILIAEDDLTSRSMLSAVLKKFGHEPVEARNGLEAWELLQKEDAPRLVILDWMMPGIDGMEILRRLRAMPNDRPPYVLMLTSKSDKAEIIAGLDAGANDYLPKPFDAGELCARVEVGRRMIEMQGALAEKIGELQLALDHIKTLRGIIPICAWCKKVRDDDGYWSQVEAYICNHTDASFTHGMCPDCRDKFLQKQEEELEGKVPERDRQVDRDPF